MKVNGENTVLELFEEVRVTSFSSYFTDKLSVWRRDKEEVAIISGWVESGDLRGSLYLDEIVADLRLDDKVKYCSYNESSRIILLEAHQIRPDWATQLNLKVRTTHKSAQPVLYYVIIHQPHKLAHSVRSITPKNVLPHGVNLSTGGDDDENFGDEKSITASENQSEDIWGDSSTVLGKRTRGEDELAYHEDRELYSFEEVVKKLKTGDIEGDKLVKSLQSFKVEQIFAIAEDMDQPTRDVMMNLLSEADAKDKDFVQKEQEPVFFTQNDIYVMNENSNSFPAAGFGAKEDFYPFPKSKFTPAMHTGSTADSPYNFFQESRRSTTKSTPVYKPITNQPLENLRPANGVLEPRGDIVTVDTFIQKETVITEIVDDKGEENTQQEGKDANQAQEIPDIEKKVECLIKEIDWSKLADKDADLGNGIKIGNGPNGLNITLPKELYEAAMKLEQEKQQAADEQEEYEFDEEDDQQEGSGEEQLVVEIEENEDGGETTKLIVDGQEVIVEEEKPQEENRHAEDDVEIRQEVEEQKQEVYPEEARKAEEERINEERRRIRPTYIESKVKITKEIRVFHLNEQGNVQEGGQALGN